VLPVKGKVLVVDDEEALVRLITIILKKRGLLLLKHMMGWLPERYRERDP
jgi:two-component SAPR family response regulator